MTQSAARLGALGLAAHLALFLVSARAEDTVIQGSPTPPGGEPNRHYLSNHEPLLPSPLAKLPVGSVQPEGWLRRQLDLMAAGMFGHLGELSRWCRKEKNAWLDPAGQGERGWEELPYWLKGFVSLAYILRDERLIAEARAWIEAALRSQEEDGYFGPRENKKNNDIWPNMVMLNVLETFHEATGDPRVLPFLLRYARWLHGLPRESLLPGSWQKIRGGDNLQSVYWLYNRTGEPWLLDLARRIHERTARWTEDIASWHGVNICQAFREPAVFYQQAKDPWYLEAAEKNYRRVMQLYGQVPGGMFGADENCRPGYSGPRQGAEACSMVEMMLSQEILLGITGNPLHADRCEEVAFNSLPAALTPDIKGLHYLTAPNAVQLDRENKSPGVENSGCMLAFSPGERYRCCQHNVSHGWPYFTERLWMATRGGGLAAVLYAPSSVEARVGEGEGVVARIVEETDYPFGETVQFRVSLPRPARFPLALRIPGWAAGARASLNEKEIEERPGPSSFLVVERTWSDGDRLRLDLPQRLRVRRWEANGNSASVDLGPLTFSLKIKEEWKRFGGSEAWPEWEVFPASAWNYGLVLDSEKPESSFTVRRKGGAVPPQPFDVEAAPVEIVARGKRIPAWKLEGGLVGVLRPSPVKAAEPVEEIVLIPMGCARLRLSAFPVVGEGEEAQEWEAK
jgi:DUF1680 family protein